MGHGVEHAPVLDEPGHAVGDLDRRARPIEQTGYEDGRVPAIGLLGVRKVEHLDGVDAALIPGRRIVEQCAERRIAVETGETPPDDRSVRIHQQPDGAIADQREVEITRHHRSHF